MYFLHPSSGCESALMARSVLNVHSEPRPPLRGTIGKGQGGVRHTCRRPHAGSNAGHSGAFLPIAITVRPHDKAPPASRDKSRALMDVPVGDTAAYLNHHLAMVAHANTGQ